MFCVELQGMLVKGNTNSNNLPATETCMVKLPPLGYHTPLYPIVLLCEITLRATRPPIDLHTLHKQILDSFGSFIIAARKINEEPQVAINTTVVIPQKCLEIKWIKAKYG
jgi:hypothetical protein